MKKITAVFISVLMIFCLAACGKDEGKQTMPVSSKVSGSTEDFNRRSLENTVPDELEYIPKEYKSPSEHPGTLEKLTYQTWESFSYEEHTQKLTKEAWVYLPYGYSEKQKYNVFYLSHGGWSNETTIMGTDKSPQPFKYVIEHAIEDGKIQPLIIVLPTYNNTSSSDSGDYSLALQLTDQFHNELVNDLIPAVEGKYSTYAENTKKRDWQRPVTIGDLADFRWAPSIHGVRFGMHLIISGILCR